LLACSGDAARTPESRSTTGRCGALHATRPELPPPRAQQSADREVDNCGVPRLVHRWLKGAACRRRNAAD
jgi:hypothetical protein